LAPTASGTRLSLVQSGFTPEQKRNFGGARYGWRMMGGKLVDLLERMP
ncbi:MAG TPA: SRPBCC domain-containing protein, partial [Methylomirabilota bacterium]|nr:SRPBCC domain-containing protein [Methylomirabilota bacterium]